MTRPPWTWTDDAACARHPQLDWTIEQTEHISRDEASQVQEAAANICASCPVRNWCATDAEISRLDPDETVRPFGVRAGRLYDGTRREPVPILREARVRALCGTGLTDGQIAETLGITADQVRYIRQRLGVPSTLNRRRPAFKPFKHGTRSGYQTHLRREEKPCDDCRIAKNAYWRARYAARRKDVA